MNSGPGIMAGLRCLAIAIAATVVAVPEYVSADETTDVAADVQVIAATADPAPAGSCTRIRFTLVNDGRESLHVLGLESGIASGSRLWGKISATQTVVLESINIPAGETIDFSQSRWFELCGLTTDLKPGDVLVLKLQMVDWTTEFSTHVH